MAEKKKKKGMVVVIAVGGKSPKSPDHTADPEKKKKSVAVKKSILKNEGCRVCEGLGIEEDGFPCDRCLGTGKNLPDSSFDV